MNSVILSLEKRKNRVLRMRNCYLFTCDKEVENYEAGLRRFDNALNSITKVIQGEWNKLYIRKWSGWYYYYLNKKVVIK